MTAHKIKGTWSRESQASAVTTQGNKKWIEAHSVQQQLLVIQAAKRHRNVQLIAYQDILHVSHLQFKKRQATKIWSATRLSFLFVCNRRLKASFFFFRHFCNAIIENPPPDTHSTAAKLKLPTAFPLFMSHEWSPPVLLVVSTTEMHFPVTEVTHTLLFLHLYHL